MDEISISLTARGTDNGKAVNGTQAELIVWIIFNVWPSHFGIPVILAVLFFTDIKRGPALINLFITEMIAGISSSILVYAGKTSGPEPNGSLCLAHASLVYGIPPMTATAAFFLVFQMFLSIRSSYYGHEVMKSSRGYRIGRWGMVILPYVVFTVSFIATAMVGAANMSKVSRNRRFFYCSVKNNALTNALGLFAGVVLVSTLAIEVWTVVLFYRRWRWSSANTPSKRFRWTDEVNLAVRIMAFAVYILICTVLSLLSMHAPTSPFPDLFISTAGTAVISIFGTQLDIIRTLCFWKRLPMAAGSQDKEVKADIEQPYIGGGLEA